MDRNKIELLTGLQRKVDYDSEHNEVLEEDIDQIKGVEVTCIFEGRHFGKLAVPGIGRNGAIGDLIGRITLSPLQVEEVELASFARGLFWDLEASPLVAFAEVEPALPGPLAPLPSSPSPRLSC